MTASEGAEWVPVATYRLQLSKDFDFDAAARVVPYLARLGVSHVYLSPILQAAAGSTHGYDVIDPAHVSADLGGEEGYLRFARAVASHGLKQVIDIVPNHMSIADRRNRWWWDVLENGPASRWASTFDVDWDPPEGRNRNVVLMPILGDHRGLVLERRELTVVREKARFTFRYMDHSLPVAPRSLGTILHAANKRLSLLAVGEDRTSAERHHAIATLAFLGDSFVGLPSPTVRDAESTARRHRDKEVLFALLERFLLEVPEAAACVDAALEEINADPEAIDAFLNQQNHRIAFWRTAERELDYRRFFDVTTLVGLRVEDEDVFSETHQLIERLVRDGVVHGLRVDHIDGLCDPVAYLDRLRRMAPRAWIVVEKILARDEALREGWPVDGTTGYDFLNDVLGLFVDPAGARPFTALHRELTGDERTFEEVAREKRELVLREVLASDVDRVVHLLAELCAGSRMHRDYTRHDLRAALRAVVGSFPVYRTYVRIHRRGEHEEWQVHEEDAAVVDIALERARAARPDLDPRLFTLLGDLLLGRARIPGAAAFTRRFQQLTSPAVAKGIEDTAFYAWSRFVALNEVGGDPGRFGASVAHFHEKNVRAFHQTPLRMVTTSTHDTKRSEDVRARLAVLSEDPTEWALHVREWRAANEAKKTGGMPDADTEHLFYQTLVGAWPLTRERALAYMMKAVREAKVHTSWTRPDAAYEEALRSFVEGCFADGAFLVRVTRAVDDVLVAGRVVSLAQTLVKLTAPGIPDVYQGTELWSLDLVDPDNRRAVDFGHRARLLEEARALTPEQLLMRADEGLPKLALVARALELRRRRPELFGAHGRYTPIIPSGEHSDRVVAWERGGGAITIVPRLTALLPVDLMHARLRLPAGLWRHVVTGEEHRADLGRELEARDLLRRFPVALLEKLGGPA